MPHPTSPTPTRTNKRGDTRRASARTLAGGSPRRRSANQSRANPEKTCRRSTASHRKYSQGRSSEADALVWWKKAEEEAKSHKQGTISTVYARIHCTAVLAVRDFNLASELLRFPAS